jgi:hypothetical protein
MIFDVLRFNLFALDILKEEGMDDMSIGEYLDREGYGDGFKEDYLLVCLSSFRMVQCLMIANDSCYLVHSGRSSCSRFPSNHLDKVLP